MNKQHPKSSVASAVPSGEIPCAETAHTTAKRGRPRKANPSPDAIRMRKVRAASSGISTNPSTQKRSLAARSVRNYRGKKSFGYMGKKAHEFGVFADRLYSRPIMRVGCHVPNL